MKTIRSIFFLSIFFASFLLILPNLPVYGQTMDSGSSIAVVNRLLSLQEPELPIIQGNSVIFTISSDFRKVGIAFAHEDFSNVYWFTKLLVPQDRSFPVILPGQKTPDPFKDAGIQFFVYELPERLDELEYRLIINGLWTTDPANPQVRRDPVSGLNLSVLNLGPRPINLNPERGLPEGLLFSFDGPPGEIITVAGNFNAWDPFMFELREGPAGTYSLLLPLPPGTYQYAFFHRGQRFTDPNNGRRIYARDGSAVSEITVP